MSNPLRRSQRLSQQYGNSSATSLPAFSASSSTLTSANSSPTIDSPSTLAHEDHLRLQLQSQYLAAPPQSLAPLPSPSAIETHSFITSAHFNSALQMSQTHQQNSALPQHRSSAQSSMQMSQSSTGQHHNSFSSTQRPNVAQTSQDQAGIPPPGFLAEAAKRAQMACLMRDLGDVTL